MVSGVACAGTKSTRRIAARPAVEKTWVTVQRGYRRRNGCGSAPDWSAWMKLASAGRAVCKAFGRLRGGRGKLKERCSVG